MAEDFTNFTYIVRTDKGSHEERVVVTDLENTMHRELDINEEYNTPTGRLRQVQIGYPSHGAGRYVLQQHVIFFWPPSKRGQTAWVDVPVISEEEAARDA